MRVLPRGAPVAGVVEPDLWDRETGRRQHKTGRVWWPARFPAAAARRRQGRRC
jgi:hypothetical protein